VPATRQSRRGRSLRAGRVARAAGVLGFGSPPGHSSPAVTLSTYAHAFAKVEHEERFRELQEKAFGDVLNDA